MGEGKHIDVVLTYSEGVLDKDKADLLSLSLYNITQTDEIPTSTTHFRVNYKGKYKDMLEIKLKLKKIKTNMREMS